MRLFICFLFMFIISEQLNADNRCFDMELYDLNFDQGRKLLIELPSENSGFWKSFDPSGENTQLNLVKEYLKSRVKNNYIYPIYENYHLISVLDFKNYKEIRVLMDKHDVKDRGTQLLLYKSIIKYSELSEIDRIVSFKKANNLGYSCTSIYKINDEDLKTIEPIFIFEKIISIDYAEGIQGKVVFKNNTGNVILNIDHVLSGYEH